MNEFVKFNLIGKSAEFRNSLNAVHRFARCNSTVLILGESGTGKELVARAIHSMGNRRDKAFVPVNCGAVPDHLVESEFFGHVKGAFTDAREARQGLVMNARGGTLFLDEIEAMSPRTQVALLRFLQSKEFRPVGGETVRNADIRIIAASNADLFAMAAEGAFRFDLLYRLNVLGVMLPPLRQRGDDVAQLACAFVDRINGRSESVESPKRLDEDSMAVLKRHDWPGNVRELENLIEKEYVMADGPVIRIRKIGNPAIVENLVTRNFDRSDDGTGPTNSWALPDYERRRGDRRRNAVASSPAEQSAVKEGTRGGTERFSDALAQTYDDFRQVRAEFTAELERTYLQLLLQRADGNLSLASRLAGKDRSNLYKLLKKHGIEPRTSGLELVTQ